MKRNRPHQKSSAAECACKRNRFVKFKPVDELDKYIQLLMNSNFVRPTSQKLVHIYLQHVWLAVSYRCWFGRKYC